MRAMGGRPEQRFLSGDSVNTYVDKTAYYGS